MPLTPDDGDDVHEDQNTQSIEEFIAERPLTAVALAALFGFVLARIVF